MTKKFLGCFVLVCSVLVVTKTASAQATLTYKPWTAETIMQGSASATVRDKQFALLDLTG
jgi:hypothetical protein